MSILHFLLPFTSLQLSDDVSHFKENVLQNAPQNPGQKEEWKMPEKQAVSTFTRRRHKICHW